MREEIVKRIEAFQDRAEKLAQARSYEQDDPGGENKKANDAEELALIEERDAIQQAIVESGEVEVVAQDVKTINLNETPENSILLIKINAEHGMQQRNAATHQIARALSPFNDLIKSKKIVPIVMADNETMEVLNEEQMAKMGWYKKEPSLIINPFTNRPAQ